MSVTVNGFSDIKSIHFNGVDLDRKYFKEKSPDKVLVWCKPSLVPPEITDITVKQSNEYGTQMQYSFRINSDAGDFKGVFITLNDGKEMCFEENTGRIENLTPDVEYKVSFTPYNNKVRGKTSVVYITLHNNFISEDSFGKGAKIIFGYTADSLVYTRDYETWEKAGSNSFMTQNDFRLAYGNGVLICAVWEQCKLMYTTDLKSWKMAYLPDRNVNETRAVVAYGNGHFIYINDKSQSYVSTDGINWRKMGEIKTNSSINGFVYNPDERVFVVTMTVGHLSYYTSDYNTWIPIPSENIPDTYSKDVSPLAYGNGTYVLFNDYRLNMGYLKNFNEGWKSVDIEFAHGKKKVIGHITAYEFFYSKKIVYGNGKFICPGSHRTLYSENGITWQTAPHNYKELMPYSTNVVVSSMMYANNLFWFFPYYDEYIFVSKDGFKWEKKDIIDIGKGNVSGDCVQIIG